MSENNATKVKFLPLDMTTYGSTSYHSVGSEESWEDTDTAADMRRRSFHLGMTKVNAGNIWTSVRNTTSFAEHGKEYGE
jgi:hypothetical protein